MEKEQVIKLFKQYNKKRIESPEVLKKIIALGFRTGSLLWGVGTEKSDLDIVLPHLFLLPHTDSLIEGLDEYFIQHFNSMYDKDTPTTFSFYGLTSSDKVVNLIVCNNAKSFTVWKKATHTMTDLIDSNGYFKNMMRLKDKRVALFEYFKEYFYKNT